MIKELGQFGSLMYLNKHLVLRIYIVEIFFQQFYWGNGNKAMKMDAHGFLFSTHPTFLRYFASYSVDIILGTCLSYMYKRLLEKFFKC